MTRRATLSRQAGMTLVEVMLVVFIVGLVAGVVVMTLPARQDPHEKAADDLGRAIRDIQDMSILTGETFALLASEDTVSLQKWDGFEWQPAGRKLTSLPEGVDIQLLHPDKRPGQDGKRGRMLVFDPLGVTEPANVVISYGMFQQTLRIEPDGEVSHVRSE